MFKFLKEKLKGAISKFSRKAGEEPKEEAQPQQPKEEKVPIIRERKELEQEDSQIKIAAEKESAHEKPEEAEAKEEITLKVVQKKEAEEFKKEENAQERQKAEEGQIAEDKVSAKEKTSAELFQEEKEEEKKGFFARLREKITTTTISEEKFEGLFSELELILMENNVALEVIEKIKNDLKKNLVDAPIKRMKIEETVRDSLKNSINDLFNIEKLDVLNLIKNKEEKPFIIAFFGINGSGKTTTIAKIAEMLKSSRISCVLAAADTFRAASIEQIQIHADKLGLKLIKHDYGSDPAAVAFDSIKHAKAKNIDAVLIDTAGRLHSNKNLMDELKKVVKVAKPDLKIFVGESIAGNDCIEQVQKYNEIVGIDAIILTKADVDEKGGTAISVSYVTKKPIIYLGVGQEYSDLKEFEPDLIVEGLGL